MSGSWLLVGLALEVLCYSTVGKLQGLRSILSSSDHVLKSARCRCCLLCFRCGTGKVPLSRPAAQLAVRYERRPVGTFKRQCLLMEQEGRRGAARAVQNYLTLATSGGAQILTYLVVGWLPGVAAAAARVPSAAASVAAAATVAVTSADTKPSGACMGPCTRTETGCG